jgi:cytochrome P450
MPLAELFEPLRTGDDILRAGPHAAALLGEAEALVDGVSEDTGGLLAVLRPLVHAGAISRELAAALMSFMFVAGYATSTRSLAALVLAIATATDDDRDRLDDARHQKLFVEEILRLFSPVGFVPYSLTGAITLHTTELGADDVVILSLASANLDERQFVQGDAIDLADRSDHFGFGSGAHACVGARLARWELGSTLLELLDVRIGVLGDVVWSDSEFVRGPDTAHITLSRLPLTRKSCS